MLRSDPLHGDAQQARPGDDAGKRLLAVRDGVLTSLLSKR
jgi:hypothetical protein